MSVSLLWVSVIWKLFLKSCLKCCSSSLEGYSECSAQLNREGMVRGVYYIYLSIYFFSDFKSLWNVWSLHLFSSHFGRLLRRGRVAVEGGLSSVPKIKARGKVILSDSRLPNCSIPDCTWNNGPPRWGLFRACPAAALQRSCLQRWRWWVFSRGKFS